MGAIGSGKEATFCLCMRPMLTQDNNYCCLMHERVFYCWFVPTYDGKKPAFKAWYACYFVNNIPFTWR